MVDFSSDEHSVKTLSLEWCVLINPFVDVTTKHEKFFQIRTIMCFIAKRILFCKFQVKLDLNKELKWDIHF